MTEVQEISGPLLNVNQYVYEKSYYENDSVRFYFIISYLKGLNIATDNQTA